MIRVADAIKAGSILISLLSTSQPAFAGGTNDVMTKIVYRNISTNVPADSFAAKPVVLYRIGDKYGRTEEAPDEAGKIHGLIIINEPDAWMINLMDKSGRHMVDGGPTYEVHDSVVSPPDPNESQAEFRAFTRSSIGEFEFGREMKFLKDHGTRKSGSETIEGVECDRYELTLDGYAIELFAKKGTEIPYRLSVTRSQSQVTCLQYETYRLDLKPDFSLFKPPAGISITEVGR